MNPDLNTAARRAARVAAIATALGVGGVLGGLGVAAADRVDAGPAVERGKSETAADSGRADAPPGRGRSSGPRSTAQTRSPKPAATRRDAPATPDRRTLEGSVPEATTIQQDFPRDDASAVPAPVSGSAAPAGSPAVVGPAAAAPATAAAPLSAVATVIARTPAPTPTPTPTPQPPVIAAAAPVGSITELPSALLGTGTGTPAESAASWMVLAATRRMGRAAPRRAMAATVTTGQAPLPAATTGTTTAITWAWGSYPVLNFNPAADKLDFGWMQASQFDVSEKSGSTVIAVVGNNHSYTLQNVPVSKLQMSNIVAKDTGTVTKWQTLISNAATTLPQASIANTAVAEGNSGTTNAAFTVTLSKPSTKTVTVGYSTANGTATAGSDYTAAAGTLTFAPGVTTQKVNVAVAGDTAVEPTETFTVKLANPGNATLGTATATGTITNDDAAPVAPPTVSISTTAVSEGNSGTSAMAFTVSLSKATDKSVTVGYSTANGTATAGQDYTATAGTLTFAAGMTSQKVNVAVAGDTAVEPTETFTVKLANPGNATLGTATATGTITNDDTATPVPPVAGDRWGTTFYAPYVDMGGWPVPDLLAISRTNGGGSLFTAAFMQATPDGKLAWAGLNALEPGATNDQAQAINRSIKALRSAGGDVMISLGGQAGTSLAQWGSTRGMTAAQLAGAYAGVIDTYGINHLDFDIEGAAVADPASIALNSQALKLLQQSKPELKIWYTLPVLPTGLTADGIKVVDAALKAGVKLAGVNVMAMDYGESAAPTSGPAAKSMGAYAIQSAESTYAQLTKLYSGYGQSFGYRQLGVTPMLGVNDVTTEVFTLADAQMLEDYARSKGLGMLSLWSVTRDTPGTLGVSTYTHSGMGVPAGSFAKIFNDYGTVNALTYPTNGGSTGGSTAPVTGGTTTVIGWQWATNTVLNFNTAKDKLDFGWMRPTNFDLIESAGSTKISIVGNNQTYTLSGVPLSQMSINNIAALDSGTVAKWQSAIASSGVAAPAASTSL